MTVVERVEQRIADIQSQLDRDCIHIMFFHSGSQYDFECTTLNCPFELNNPTQTAREQSPISDSLDLDL